MRNSFYAQLCLVVTAIGATSTFSSGAFSQQFSNVAGGTTLPHLGLATEAAKFGDWDLDGDLDLVYANGGDANNQQSKLLRNNGLAQGGTIGTFSDVTSTKLLKSAGVVIMAQSSRDIQIVDIDHDGDLDFYFSNHSTGTNQSNTWMINQGGSQGGAVGEFRLDMSRWVGVGAAGSSVPAAQKLVGGDFNNGFVDWSCQCDFADVDRDGDMDLLHTSYGPAFNAQVMTRLYLNSGSGFFSEYNPSNAVSGNPSLAAGSAAGFVEGTQQENTTNTNGTFHDITNMSLDADFADLDGDFDNDIFANSRDTISHFYQNRFVENGNSLGNGTTTRLYRDVTSLWGTNGLAAESGANYESDLNDIDNDNDVDGYFLNYDGGTGDATRLNNGTGAFSASTSVPNSGNDDNEIDWIDFDNDGDNDVFISAFASTDRIYRNNFNGAPGSATLTEVFIASGVGGSSLGSDVGDMDNDGDPDIISAEDGGGNEVLLRNSLNVPDPIAPRVPHLLDTPDGPPTSGTRRIVARAFDNANQEYFQHGSAVLNFTVNGEPHSIPGRYSGGNLFTALLPGYWSGTVTYSMSVTDRKGNTGTSGSQSVTVPLVGFSTFGSDIVGCSGPLTLSINSTPTINNPDFQLRCTGAPANTLQLCWATDVQGVGNDEFGIGIPMWGSFFGATEIYGLDANAGPTGQMITPIAIPNNAGLIGNDYYFQFIVGDAGCGTPLYTSRGGKVIIQP
ncbi:MAG: FG-GAP repeat domain-containing protein [Planctomycetota bacterium]